MEVIRMTSIFIFPPANDEPASPSRSQRVRFPGVGTSYTIVSFNSNGFIFALEEDI